MAAGGSNPVRAILFAFFANLGIALAKTVAAVITGSTSMVAEAIHSYADTGNQCLLLLGLKRAKKPSDAEHPLGYGKLSYFWSFMVAILLFSVGGLFSLYEGFHKLESVQEVEHVAVALSVLGASILLELVSMWGCLREVNILRGRRTLWRWLHESRNAELVVVFGEDLAALLGLVIAFVFVALAGVTGDPVYDAVGSMAIGAILLIIATFVGLRVKSLLVGRSADPDLVDAIELHIRDADGVHRLHNVITVQMGPRIMLAAKIELDADLSARDVCARINDLEVALKRQFPEIGWCFMEPDYAD